MSDDVYKYQKFTGHWDEIFRDAHLSSGPATSGLTVSKAVPHGARDIWNEDKAEILAAASRHGYRVLTDNNKIISFIKAKSNPKESNERRPNQEASPAGED